MDVVNQIINVVNQVLHNWHISVIFVLGLWVLHKIYVNFLKDWLFFRKEKEVREFEMKTNISEDPSYPEPIRDLARGQAQGIAYKSTTRIKLDTAALRSFFLKLYAHDFSLRQIRLLVKTLRIKDRTIIIRPLHYLAYPILITLYSFFMFHGWFVSFHFMALSPVAVIAITSIFALYFNWLYVSVRKCIQTFKLRRKVYQACSSALKVDS